MTTAATDPVIDFQSNWANLDLPAHVREVLSAAPLVQTPENRPQLLDWALGRSSGTTDWTLGNRDDHGVYEYATIRAYGDTLHGLCAIDEHRLANRDGKLIGRILESDSLSRSRRGRGLRQNERRGTERPERRAAKCNGNARFQSHFGPPEEGNFSSLVLLPLMTSTEKLLVAGLGAALGAGFLTVFCGPDSSRRSIRCSVSGISTTSPTTSS